MRAWTAKRGLPLVSPGLDTAPSEAVAGMGSDFLRCAEEIGDVAPENPDVSRIACISRRQVSRSSTTDRFPRPAGISVLPLPGSQLKVSATATGERARRLDGSLACLV